MADQLREPLDLAALLAFCSEPKTIILDRELPWLKKNVLRLLAELEEARGLLSDFLPRDRPSSLWLDHEEYLPMPRPTVGAIRRGHALLNRTTVPALLSTSEPSDV